MLRNDAGELTDAGRSLLAARQAARANRFEVAEKLKYCDVTALTQVLAALSGRERYEPGDTPYRLAWKVARTLFPVPGDAT